GTERVLMALGKAGADRQEIHERLRQHALISWQAVQAGQTNPLVERVCNDPVFLSFLKEKELHDLLDASTYTGDAPYRARALVETIRDTLG
ncbi:MAG TPA: hypothetical protein VGA03_00990, partial [Anaerolineales bacterium]